jgi:mRNA interferase MazF
VTIPVRARVYWADLGYGEKPWLCVSNNARNQQLDTFLAVRITTSLKPELETVVPLAPVDPLVGNILCDDLNQIGREEIIRDGGAIGLRTMMRVSAGLQSAMAL